MTGTYGFTTKLGIDSVNPVTKRFNFLSDGLVAVEEHAPNFGMPGSRSEPSERNRPAIRRAAGPIALLPNPVELNLLLEWILGGTPIVGTPVGKTTFPVGDTAVTRFVTSDRGSKVFTYDTVAVDRATFRSTQGGPLSLTLDCVAKDEIDPPGAAGSFPAISIDLTQHVFMHYELVLTINSVAHKCPDFELIVDNLIDKERFFNSITLTSVQATGRNVLLNTRLPYGDSSAAYNLTSAGVAADATFTNGALSLQFVMPKLQIPRQTPPVNDRGEVFLPISAVARKQGSTPGTTDELSVILDLT